MSDRIQAKSALKHHILQILKRSDGTQFDVARRIVARSRHDSNFRNALIAWAGNCLARIVTQKGIEGIIS